MYSIKSSDILKAALDLADLNNSSMPTVEENKFWLNSAFTRVHQQAINNGEKYFFNTADITTFVNDAADLPEDFYQLYDVRDLTNNYPIRRYQKYMTTETSYDIEGTKLVVRHAPTNGVKIYYFKNPPVIYDGSTDVTLDFPNHIFYQIVVVYLAQYYKIKQGADISALQVLSNDLWQTYYDVLRRDVNQPLVIQDVYHHTSWQNGIMAQ